MPTRLMATAVPIKAGVIRTPTMVAIASGSTDLSVPAMVTVPNNATFVDVPVTANVPNANVTVMATLGIQVMSAQVRVLAADEAPTTVTLSPAMATVAAAVSGLLGTG